MPPESSIPTKLGGSSFLSRAETVSNSFIHSWSDLVCSTVVFRRFTFSVLHRHLHAMSITSLWSSVAIRPRTSGVRSDLMYLFTCLISSSSTFLSHSLRLGSMGHVTSSGTLRPSGPVLPGMYPYDRSFSVRKAFSTCSSHGFTDSWLSRYCSTPAVVRSMCSR